MFNLNWGLIPLSLGYKYVTGKMEKWRPSLPQPWQTALHPTAPGPCDLWTEVRGHAVSFRQVFWDVWRQGSPVHCGGAVRARSDLGKVMSALRPKRWVWGTGEEGRSQL